MHWALLLSIAMVPSDDRDVIQASLLSFYKKETWHSAEWQPKQPIQLIDTYANGKVLSIGSDDATKMELALRNLQADVDAHLKVLRKKSNKTKRDFDWISYYENITSELKRITPLLKREGDSVPLRGLKPRYESWDARIQLVEEINRELRSGPVWASASRPRYSESGLHAWVSFRLPWSGNMHSADVQFVLEKSKGTWRVLFGFPKFYP